MLVWKWACDLVNYVIENLEQQYPPPRAKHTASAAAKSAFSDWSVYQGGENPGRAYRPLQLAARSRHSKTLPGRRVASSLSKAHFSQTVGGLEADRLPGTQRLRQRVDGRAHFQHLLRRHWPSEYFCLSFWDDAEVEEEAVMTVDGAARCCFRVFT